MSSGVLGLDIGGANLKAADPHGIARTVPFALWKQPGKLPHALRALLAALPPADALAVTMTGELCDCFASKREGVNAILDAVLAVAQSSPVRVWSTQGRFLSPQQARQTPLEVASANWHALATFHARFVPQGTGLLIDVGSTTTDLLPLRDGRPVPQGWTDPERLRSGELVYLGVRRTPLIGLMAGAAELFATVHDVFLVLGEAPEDPADSETADGRPATLSCAHARLARMLCGDLETTTEQERLDLAREVRWRLMMRLAFAIEAVARRLPQMPGRVILSGSGEFLAREALYRQEAIPPGDLVSLANSANPAVSTAGCAHAVAMLCLEGC
jgi:probable H4MPT-linked C1 transfer pathway protein